MLPASSSRTSARANINRAMVVQEREFNTFSDVFEASVQGNSIWDIAQTLRDRQNGNDYFVVTHNRLTNQVHETSSMREFREFFINNFQGTSGQFRSLFGAGEDIPGGSIHMVLYRVDGGGVPGRPIDYRFMARQKGAWSKMWGLYGDTANCVIRQIGERITYWLPSGDKRAYAWDGDRKLSIDPDSPEYRPDVALKLSKDKNLLRMRKALLQFKGDRQYDPDIKGLDMRDVSDLAELLKARIMIWTVSRLFPILRWDANSHDGESNEQPYVFGFYLTSTRHLEMIEDEKMSDIVWNPRAVRDYKPKELKIHYVDDHFFDRVMNGKPGGYTDDEIKVYTIRRECPRWPIPDCVKDATRYASVILQEGCNVFKHELYKDYIEETLGLCHDDPGIDKRFLADVMCHADLHWKRLVEGYNQCNVRKIVQKDSPSLFAAVRFADKVVAHTMYDTPIGVDLYEVDGRKWYLTDFSKTTDFPYFHGYPMHHAWHEYNGRSTYSQWDRRQQKFVKIHSMIGNAYDYDRPFTFSYSKYAIFMVESLDLSGCTENFVSHMRRDKIFTDFDTENFVCVLPSPILHFLQDNGVRWRASYVWVCYGCEQDWVPNVDEQWRLAMREDMKKHKSYCICMGKLMSGRDPVFTTQYLVQDDETATDLVEMNRTVYSLGPREDAPEPCDYAALYVNPTSLIYAENSDVYGTSTLTRATFKRGGYLICRKLPDGSDDPDAPFYVKSVTDMWGYGSTMCHISGAQHAYAFVRLYQATIRLPPDSIAGFSLDSIKTLVDPAELLSDFISTSESSDGYFKPPVKTTTKPGVRFNPRLLSDVYTRRGAFDGLSKPDKDKPSWGAHQDMLGRYTIVTGPAGSGKTTRHFHKFDTDDRIDASRTCYCTLTNYLTAKMKRDLGCRMALTSYKTFNRRLNDDHSHRPARDRYERRNHNPAKCERMKVTSTCHTIFLDEVTMQDPRKVADAIEVCRQHHMQLILVGDFDEERFYQLGCVSNSGTDVSALMMKVFEKAESGTIRPSKFSRIALEKVVRQQGDQQLTDLLCWLRNSSLDIAAQWRRVVDCGVFEKTSYGDAVNRFDASRDLFVCPCHDTITAITEDVYSRMGEEDVLQIRGNFDAPYTTKPSDPQLVKDLAPFQDDPLAYKGAVARTTKGGLRQLQDTKFMSKGFPYHMQSGSGNQINPMIGTTVFTLQGLTIEQGCTLYLHSSAESGADWLNDTQPKALYVALSRARIRSQVVIVTGKPQGLKRRRLV